LDRSTYSFSEIDGGVLVQSTPPLEVVDTIQRGTADAEKYLAAAKLQVKYYIDPRNGITSAPAAAELVADLEIARELLDYPPSLRSGDEWDVPALVAATVLDAHFLQGVEITSSAVEFAARTVVRIAAGEADSRDFDSVDSYFEMGAERSAARVLPLLMLPAARSIRASLAVTSAEIHAEESTGADGVLHSAITAGATNLASAFVNEVRVHFARGMDALWATECSSGSDCHHLYAFALVIATMRDCVFGEWNDDTGTRELKALEDPVVEALTHVDGEAIFMARLDAAIRALAPAATASTCVSEDARTLLDVTIDAHRRGQLARSDDYDQRGTHALQVARAILNVIASEEVSYLIDHLEAFADNSTLLRHFLTALSAAAEECPTRAATAQRIGPSVVQRVLELHDAGHCTFDERHDGNLALAALLPNLAYEHSFLYRENEAEPIT
jgi:hypothetical protein